VAALTGGGNVNTREEEGRKILASTGRVAVRVPAMTYHPVTYAGVRIEECGDGASITPLLHGGELDVPRTHPRRC